jgi:hypothetical protein
MPGSELKGTGRAAIYPNARVVSELNKGYKGGGVAKKGKGVAL